MLEIRVFIYFSVGGTLAQVSGVSFLNCLWLCLRVDTFLCQSVAQYPWYRCCASRVVGVLLQQVSLVLLPGAPGWWCLCNVQDVLSHRFCHCRGSGGGDPGCWAPVPCLVLGSWAPSLQGWGGGPESWVPPQLERWGHRPTASAAQLPVTMGASVVRSRESCVLPPLLLLGSLELWTQPLWQGNWSWRHCLHCPPWFWLLYVFQPT